MLTVDYPAFGYLPVNIACFSPFCDSNRILQSTKKGAGVLLCNQPHYSVEGGKFFLNLELISLPRLAGTSCSNFPVSVPTPHTGYRCVQVHTQLATWVWGSKLRSKFTKSTSSEAHVQTIVLLPPVSPETQ